MRFRSELPTRLTEVFTGTPKRRWIGLAALLTACQAANAAGCLYQRAQSLVGDGERLSKACLTLRDVLQGSSPTRPKDFLGTTARRADTRA